jgi:hypothetical protein
MLSGKSGLSVKEGSPIDGDLRKFAPIYLQAGEKESSTTRSVISPKPPSGNRPK